MKTPMIKKRCKERELEENTVVDWYPMETPQALSLPLGSMPQIMKTSPFGGCTCQFFQNKTGRLVYVVLYYEEPQDLPSHPLPSMLPPPSTSSSGAVIPGP
jgi:hypothetical protein